MNNLPCGKCSFFDEKTMLRNGNPTKLGWCSATSKYPATDPIDRPAPRGAMRVGAGELARPVVKARAQIETGCTWARPAAAAAPTTRAELLAKAQGKR